MPTSSLAPGSTCVVGMGATPLTHTAPRVKQQRTGVQVAAEMRGSSLAQVSSAPTSAGDLAKAPLVLRHWCYVAYTCRPIRTERPSLGCCRSRPQEDRCSAAYQRPGPGRIALKAAVIQAIAVGTASPNQHGDATAQRGGAQGPCPRAATGAEGRATRSPTAGLPGRTAADEGPGRKRRGVTSGATFDARHDPITTYVGVQRRPTTLS
jgi:hypothetical protein